jgi:hypothetical protein
MPPEDFGSIPKGGSSVIDTSYFWQIQVYEVNIEPVADTGATVRRLYQGCRVRRKEYGFNIAI